MTPDKSNCLSCGAEIRWVTAQKNNGYCMPCINGAPPDWARRQLWKKRGVNPSPGTKWYDSPWRNEICAICQGIEFGTISPVEGALRLNTLSQIVLDAAHGEKWLHPDWKTFLEVAFAVEQMQTPPEVGSSFEQRWANEIRQAASILLQQVD